MGIDLVILSRGREKELSETLYRLSNTSLHVIVMHNNNKKLSIDCFGKNITYVFCPDLNFGERASRAIKYLKNDYCIIGADDDGLVESELLRMEKFLEANSDFSSVGGIAVGAFPYGKSVAGAIAYREMIGYLSRTPNRNERIKNHLLPLGNRHLPRTALYRLSRKELAFKLLHALGESSIVGTPYIYEVTAEIVSAWAGNTIYLQNPYWIRNWKNEMISKDDWNRQYGFDKWWSDIGRSSEKEAYLSFLSSYLNLDRQFVQELLTSYASEWRRFFTEPPAKSSSRIWKFGRSQLQIANLKFRPTKAPTSLETLLLREFPSLSGETKEEICTLAYRMFFSEQ